MLLLFAECAAREVTRILLARWICCAGAPSADAVISVLPGALPRPPGSPSGVTDSPEVPPDHTNPVSTRARLPLTLVMRRRPADCAADVSAAAWPGQGRPRRRRVRAPSRNRSIRTRIARAARQQPPRMGKMCLTVARVTRYGRRRCLMHHREPLLSDVRPGRRAARHRCERRRAPYQLDIGPLARLVGRSS